jgi:hypothetical protein
MVEITISGCFSSYPELGAPMQGENNDTNKAATPTGSGGRDLAATMYKCTAWSGDSIRLGKAGELERLISAHCS